MKKKKNKNKNNVDDVTFGTGYRLFALILYMPDMMYVPRDEKFVCFLFLFLCTLPGKVPSTIQIWLLLADNSGTCTSLTFKYLENLKCIPSSFKNCIHRSNNPIQRSSISSDVHHHHHHHHHRIPASFILGHLDRITHIVSYRIA